MSSENIAAKFFENHVFVYESHGGGRHHEEKERLSALGHVYARGFRTVKL